MKNISTAPMGILASFLFPTLLFSGPNPLVSDLQNIHAQLPDYTTEALQNLMVDRVGSEQGYMKTLGLHHVVHTGQLYQLSVDGLRTIDFNIITEEIRDLSDEISRQDIKMIVPKHAVLVGNWNKISNEETEVDLEKAANILGGSGRFCLPIDDTIVHVPLEIATPEKLAYYGAILLKMGDVVRFPFEEVGYPIWAMSIGVDYVAEYIMTSKGGGWYLEWHTDRPHFHMPLSKEASGEYLLAKKVREGVYNITAFRIPYGFGVFTPRGIIHCDAGLIGEDWVVGYNFAQDFSTVLLRNQKGKFIQLVFEK